MWFTVFVKKIAGRVDNYGEDIVIRRENIRGKIVAKVVKFYEPRIELVHALYNTVASSGKIRHRGEVLKNF